MNIKKLKLWHSVGLTLSLVSSSALCWDITPLDLDGFEGETVEVEVIVEKDDWVAAGTVCDSTDWDFEFQLDGTVADGTATWGQDLANPFSGGMLDGICSNTDETSSTVFSISLLKDFIVEATEFAAIKFEHCDSPSLCSDETVTIEIFDEGGVGGDVPEISIEAVKDAAEPDVDGAFLVSISTPAPKDGITVIYLVEGTAEPGSDYKTLSGTAVIPAGRTELTIAVEVISDFVEESTETVKIVLLKSSAYKIIPQLARATIDIEDGSEIVAFYINQGLNDAWFNLDTDGQGFFIVVFPDEGTIFLAWFTYDTERPHASVIADLGDPGARWLTAYGPFSGNTATLAIELTQGGVFNSTTPKVTQSPDGTITLEFTDCENGTITFSIPSINQQGVIQIKRLALDNVDWCRMLNADMQMAQ